MSGEPYEIIDISGQFGAVPYLAHVSSPAGLERRARENGIDRTFAVELAGVYHDFVAGNLSAHAAARAHASLIPAATLNPRRSAQAAAEIQRCANADTRLYRFFPDEQGNWSPRDPCFRELAELIAGADGTLMIDTGSQSGLMTDVVSVLRGVDVNLIFGNVSYVTASESIALMRANPHVYVESRRLCTPDALEVHAAAVGADRVLFGTGGAPFNARAALNLVLHANLPEADKRLILAGNAKRVILGEPASDTPTQGLAPNPFGRPVRRGDTPPIVDVHCHDGPWPWLSARSPRSQGLDYIRQLMRKYNVEKALVSSTLGIMGDFREGNRTLIEAARGSSDVFAYVVVNANDVAGSCAEMDRYYGEPNVLGAKVHTQTSRVELSDPRMHALFAEIAARGKPAVSHVMTGFTPGDWSQVDGMAELAARFPDLPMVAYHAGGLDWQRMLDLAEDLPNLYLEYASSYPQENPVREAVLRIGAERVLFGSDMDLLSPSFTLGVFESAGLSEADMEAVLNRNAKRLFGLA